MPSHIEAQAWRKGSAQDASDDYSSGVVAGFNLARLTPETNLALISLEHNIIQLWGNQIAERSRTELGAKAVRKMQAVRSRKKLIDALVGHTLTSRNHLYVRIDIHLPRYGGKREIPTFLLSSPPNVLFFQRRSFHVEGGGSRSCESVDLVRANA